MQQKLQAKHHYISINNLSNYVYEKNDFPNYDNTFHFRMR